MIISTKIKFNFDFQIDIEHIIRRLQKLCFLLIILSINTKEQKIIIYVIFYSKNFLKNLLNGQNLSLCLKKINIYNISHS
jgi:hypothetical protein